MTDFERMYSNLAEEVNTVMLKSPGELRRRADRQARFRLAGTAVAVAALVGGIAVGGQWVLRAGNPPTPQPGTSQGVPTPAPTPTATPSAPPSTSRPYPTPTASPARPRVIPVPTQIPDRAFLQLADTNGDVPPETRPGLRMLPTLCGATYPSDSDIATRRARYITYWATQREPGYVPDGTFTETITAYRSDRAKTFMRELSRAVSDCPTERRNGTTYKHRLLPPSDHGGDEALLIEVRYPTRDPEGKPIGGDDVRLVSVVREGPVVMMLYETGWEDGWSAERPVVNAFTEKAMKRLRDWLG